MTTFFRPVFLAAAALPLLFSCSKTEPDLARYMSYVNVSLEGESYFFTGTSGKTFYPGDVSRIGRYPGDDTENGNRALIYFNFLSAEREGFDYNVALYDVIDILTKTVETAENEEDVETVGDDPLAVEFAMINGNWLDITFSLLTDYGNDIVHKMTLLDNQTVDAPESMPEDYQYLEFRQSGNNRFKKILGLGRVSYDLGAYAPSETGKKGLYIRIRNLRDNVEYLKIDYKAPKENQALSGSGVPAASGLTLR